MNSGNDERLSAKPQAASTSAAPAIKATRKAIPRIRRSYNGGRENAHDKVLIIAGMGRANAHATWSNATPIRLSLHQTGWQRRVNRSVSMKSVKDCGKRKGLAISSRAPT